MLKTAVFSVVRTALGKRYALCFQSNAILGKWPYGRPLNGSPDSGRTAGQTIGISLGKRRSVKWAAPLILGRELRSVRMVAYSYTASDEPTKSPKVIQAYARLTQDTLI